MRCKTLNIAGAVLVALTSSFALEASASTTQPSPRVEIFPFTSDANTSDGDWVGRGIAQNLQSDVSHTGATLILPPHTIVASDDAVTVAKENHADLAVTGTYQVVGDQIRVNGNVVDTTNNASIGGFSATGLRSDLFKVEDALGEQLRQLLPKPLTLDEIAQTAIQPPLPAVETYQQPSGYYNLATSPGETYYDNAPPVQVYVAPAYTDLYPFGFYGGLGYYGGFNNHFGYGHRGFEHHESSHGFYGRPNPSFHNPVYRGSGPSLNSHVRTGGFYGCASGGGFHGGGASRGGSGGGHR